MKTLIAVGGGLDSTWLLWELLAQTADDVTALYCDLSAVQYNDPRAIKDFWKASAVAEQIAVNRSGQWLASNVRPFTLQIIPVTSSTDARAPTVIRVAAGLAAGFDRFILGRAPEQMCTPKNTPYYQKIWTQNAPAGILMQWPLVDRNQGRPHAMVALPAALQSLTISCHDPSVAAGDPVRDGTCAKCFVTDECRRLLGLGVSPDEILDLIKKKVGAAPYHGSLAVDKRWQSGRATDELTFISSPEE